VGGGRHRLPKDGTHSVGVQRQDSGTLGTTANCQLGVSVNAVTEQASCPLDWRLFLPAFWEDDTTRRAACQVPASVRHRPKWRLVLDLLDGLERWGLRPPMLVADPGYGEVGAFRQGLDDRQIPYVVQVKADTSAYPGQVRPTTAPYTGKGRRPRPRDRDKPASLKQLALAAGQGACVDLIWRRGSKGLQRSRFLALRVRPAGITPRRQAAAGADGVGWELPTRWLLVGWPASKPEPVKYWLSNLPATTPLVELVRLGKLRWRVEQDYRECKGALGWTTSRAILARVAPPRDPGLGRPRVPHPGAAGPPETGGVGLSFWQLVAGLQVLLGCWAGACPLASGQHRAGYDGDDHTPRPDRALLGRDPSGIDADDLVARRHPDRVRCDRDPAHAAQLGQRERRPPPSGAVVHPRQ
jgi:hypothetical protein